MPAEPLLPDTAELRRRFAFRPELGLLYDRRHGLEHRLNETAAALVSCTFSSPEPASAVARQLGITQDFAAGELARFWSQTVLAHTRPHSTRKSGAPPGWAAADLAFPLVIEVELTKVCNWHCDFCYNVWKVPDDYGRRARSVTGGAGEGLHLPIEAARRILEEAAANDCLRIRFSGGEPTLHPRFREIIACAGEKGFDIELFSNGTLIDQSMASFLARSGVRVLLVSVHGLAATHNRMTANPRAFEHAMNAIAAGLEAGMTVLPECLVSAENIGEVPGLVTRLAGLGVRHASFMPYVPYGAQDPRRAVALRAVQNLIGECTQATGGAVSFRVPCAPRHCLETEPVPIAERVAEEFDDHCAAGVLWMSASYDGRLRHCPHSAVYAGDLTEGIGQVWRERIVPTVREALQPSHPACAGCGQFAACQGGCHLGKVRSYPGAPPGRRLLPVITARGR
jgi:radical SAM protein with 4Fe4S-binding SPASM domain